MSDVSLRPVVSSDAEFLERVYASTRSVELEPVPWTAEQKSAFLAHQFHAQSVHYAHHYGHASFDVILVDGLPAGRLIVERYGDRLHVVDIALLDEFRGHGIGTNLLRELIAEAGERPVSIYVERGNPARNLYRRLGFVPAGEHGPYLLMRRTYAKTAS